MPTEVQEGQQPTRLQRKISTNAGIEADHKEAKVVSKYHNRIKKPRARDTPINISLQQAQFRTTPPKSLHTKRGIRAE